MENSQNSEISSCFKYENWDEALEEGSRSKVEINLIHALDPTNPITIRDDRRGKLLAPSGILAPNPDNKVEIDYNQGIITFTVGSSFNLAPNDTYAVIGYKDSAGSPGFGTLNNQGNNRFNVDIKNILVTAELDISVANPQNVSGTKLTELYTQSINDKLVKAIQTCWNGNTFEFDASIYNDSNSRLYEFQSALIDVDAELAKRSDKGISASAYVVGKKTANWFRKLASKDCFVYNTSSSYINDLLGYYNSIPVLCHTDVGVNEGYAIHKSEDGQLAPVMRGIFLPLTSTPSIGNYNNPTQFASGIYYQEAYEPIAPKLIQHFSINA